MGPITEGAYVEAPDHGVMTRGIVRRISGDGRVVYVELEGDADLWRYSPDELRLVR